MKDDKHKYNHECQGEDEQRMGIYYFSVFYLVPSSSGFWGFSGGFFGGPGSKFLTNTCN